MLLITCCQFCYLTSCLYKKTSILYLATLTSITFYRAEPGTLPNTLLQKGSYSFLDCTTSFQLYCKVRLYRKHKALPVYSTQFSSPCCSTIGLQSTVQQKSLTLAQTIIQSQQSQNLALYKYQKLLDIAGSRQIIIQSQLVHNTYIFLRYLLALTISIYILTILLALPTNLLVKQYCSRSCCCTGSCSRLQKYKRQSVKREQHRQNRGLAKHRKTGILRLPKARSRLVQSSMLNRNTFVKQYIIQQSQGQESGSWQNRAVQVKALQFCQ